MPSAIAAIADAITIALGLGVTGLAAEAVAACPEFMPEEERVQDPRPRSATVNEKIERAGAHIDKDLITGDFCPFVEGLELASITPATHLMAINIGDCLEPEIPAGTLLVIEKDRPPRNGDLVWAQGSIGEGMVKQYLHHGPGTCSFALLCSKYSPMHQFESARLIMGVVVGAIPARLAPILEEAHRESCRYARAQQAAYERRGRIYPEQRAELSRFRLDRLVQHAL